MFVFFGLVAVNGTAYAITQQPSWVALLASVAIGLLAVALMLTNNLRDIPTDVIAGKRTLAVRLGDRGTRLLYTAAVLAPFALMVPVTWCICRWRSCCWRCRWRSVPCRPCCTALRGRL